MNTDRSNEKLKSKKIKQVKSVKGNTELKDNSKRIKTKRHKQKVIRRKPSI